MVDLVRSICIRKLSFWTATDLAVFGFNQAGVAQIRPAYVRIS